MVILQMYLDKYESVELGNGLHAVFHLIVRDLYQTTVALPPHHGVEAVARDPGVHLDLLQLDPLTGVLQQHLTEQVQQLWRQVAAGWELQYNLLVKGDMRVLSPAGAGS